MGTEDFTTYTEVDGGGDITVIVARVTWVTMIRNVLGYVYKDFTPGFFGDFSIDYTVDFSSIEAGDGDSRAFVACIALANALGGYSTVAVTSDWAGLICINIGTSDNIFTPRLEQWDGGVQKVSDGGAARGLVPYYITFDRAGTTLRIRIYSDAARTILLETLSDAGAETTTYRYAYAVESVGSAADPNDNSSGFVEDMNLNLGWSGKIAGVTDPAEIAGVAKANIAEVKSVA